jgi:UDP-glucose 4-epimerase
VSDVIDAVRLGLVNDDWTGPVVIGSGKSMSVLEVVEAVRDVTGASFEVTHGPARPGEMPAVIVDPSRAKSFGWSPQFDFETGLRGVWEEWSVADVDAIAAGAPAAPVTAGGGR